MPHSLKVITNPLDAPDAIRPMLAVEGLSKVFGSSGLFSRRKEVRAVDGVSFSIRDGETLALVGESGCGKSTTGRLVLRLLDATSGSIRFSGCDIRDLPHKDLTRLRRDMQIVFQDPYSSLNPRMTVRDLIGEPLLIHEGMGRADMDARVAELLSIVGLRPDHARRYPHEFSGGQRQRIGIARAIALSPKLVVCDEAVSALDVSVQAQVVNLLQDIQERVGLSYLFISHDLTVVRQMAHQVAVMYLGRIVETAPTEDLFRTPRHPYTRLLLDAIPVPDPSRRQNRTVANGELPSPLAPPPGCHFHPRCPYATAVCKTTAPEPEIDPLGHQVSCHHWQSLPPRPVRIQGASEGNERLQRLQSRFSEHSDSGRATPTPINTNHPQEKASYE